MAFQHTLRDANGQAMRAKLRTFIRVDGYFFPRGRPTLTEQAGSAGRLTLLVASTPRLTVEEDLFSCVPGPVCTAQVKHDARYHTYTD